MGCRAAPIYCLARFQRRGSLPHRSIELDQYACPLRLADHRSAIHYRATSLGLTKLDVPGVSGGTSPCCVLTTVNAAAAACAGSSPY